VARCSARHGSTPSLQLRTCANTHTHTHTHTHIHTHTQRNAGAKLLWGGQPLQNHTIPECYGAIQPTAVFVPLHSIMRDPAAFKLATTEVFGPFQIITEYNGACCVTCCTKGGVGGGGTRAAVRHVLCQAASTLCSNASS
jgi:hypothetical protein